MDSKDENVSEIEELETLKNEYSSSVDSLSKEISSLKSEKDKKVNEAKYARADIYSAVRDAFFDHIIIGTRNPASTINLFEKLGFTIKEGRQHKNGIDNFKFWDKPILLPETNDPDINVYDMRLVEHEDGFIYGLFCTERKDPNAVVGETSSAIAGCGIVRTKDLLESRRLCPK